MKTDCFVNAVDVKLKFSKGFGCKDCVEIVEDIAEDIVEC